MALVIPHLVEAGLDHTQSHGCTSGARRDGSVIPRAGTGAILLQHLSQENFVAETPFILIFVLILVSFSLLSQAPGHAQNIGT